MDRILVGRASSDDRTCPAITVCMRGRVSPAFAWLSARLSFSAPASGQEQLGESGRGVCLLSCSFCLPGSSVGQRLQVQVVPMPSLVTVCVRESGSSRPWFGPFSSRFWCGSVALLLPGGFLDRIFVEGAGSDVRPCPVITICIRGPGLARVRLALCPSLFLFSCVWPGAVGRVG